MLSCICLLKNVWKYVFIYRIWNQKVKTELNELNDNDNDNNSDKIGNISNDDNDNDNDNINSVELFCDN